MPATSATTEAGGGTTRAPDKFWAIPPPPYVALAGLLCLGAGLGFTLALAPAKYPDVQRLDFYGASMFVLLALAVWFGAPRIANQWGLDAALISTMLVLFVGVSQVDLDAGRVTSGFVVVLLAVYAAYFRPRRRFLAELVILITGYGIATLLVGPSMPVVYFLVVAIVTSAAAVAVAVLVARLRRQALTDALTGLLNRRGLAVMSDLVARQADREGTPTSIALIDLDGFKQYNDHYGHVAGDRLLMAFGQALTGALRSTDVVARFGGDEFAVLLPATTAARAHDLMQRVRAQELGCSWTVGIAVSEPGSDLAAAISCADVALYAAKQRERRR